MARNSVMKALRTDREATGHPSPGEPPAAGELDSLAFLARLSTPVVCVRPDETIALVNDAAAAVLGNGALASRDKRFWDALPALRDEGADAVIRRTSRDGVPRTYRIALPGGRADASYEVRVTRVDPGWLVLELHDAPGSSRRGRRGSGATHSARNASPTAAAVGDAATMDELRAENASLRTLARQMSAVPDTETLLRTLCDVVVTWCDADGAGVGQIEGDGGVVVTARGEGAPESGQRFPLAGSVAERAIAARGVVSEPDYANGNQYMRPWAEANDVGEMMVAPLFIADRAVGMVNAYRKRGREPFSPRDADHLRVIADHAAVALAKVRLLEDAHAASVARSNFLAAVSHELRTPLTTLAGYGELLADDILGELTPAQHETIERMRSVTHQLSALIDEILTYSSLEAGCELVRAHETTSEDIFTAAVAAVEPLARQKGLRLTTHLPAIPVAMTTDADKVRQILVNLMSNAVKFTHEGSVDVSVEARGEGKELHFKVVDTGIGIARADIPRLFQPFMQLDGGLTRRHGGTGLGLYISRRLAHLLGGRIDVQSTPGIGSTFTLVIPARYSRA